MQFQNQRRVEGRRGVQARDHWSIGVGNPPVVAPAPPYLEKVSQVSEVGDEAEHIQADGQHGEAARTGRQPM